METAERTGSVLVVAEEERSGDRLDAAGFSVQRRSGSLPGTADLAAVDCVVVAGGVAGRGSIETVAAVRERASETPVVLLTASERLERAGLMAGAAECVRPSDDGLVAVVDRIVGERSVAVRPGGGAGDVPESLKERAMDEAPVGITIADMSRDDEPLVYANEAFGRLTGYPAEEVIGRNCRFLQGDGTGEEPVARMREAIENGEEVSVELRNYRKDGTRFWNKVDLAPIYDGDDLTHYVGFQTDITQRKEAQRAAQRRTEELRQERADLQRLLDRIEGLLGDVTRTLVEATSRGGIERAVCDRLAEADRYDFAWIGDRDLGTGRVVPRTGTGDDLHEIGLEIDLEGTGPVADAMADRDVVVVEDARTLPEGRLHGPEWPDRFRSMAAVPLAYRDTLYGVLVVYGEEPEAFGEHERVVLSSIGRGVATAINALETQQTVADDDATELEFDLHDTGAFFDTLASAADCRLTYVGEARREDDATLLFFDIDGADGDATRQVVADRSLSVEPTVLTDHEDGCLCEFALGSRSIVETLAERGVEVASITAEPGQTRLVARAPASADVRAVVDTLEQQYPDAELVAYRDRDRPAKTRREFVESIEDRLTDRQATALAKAHAGGFFEWPHGVSGEQLADSMDVSKTTYHEHLRAALRKLVEEFHER